MNKLPQIEMTKPDFDYQDNSRIIVGTMVHPRNPSARSCNILIEFWSDRVIVSDYLPAHKKGASPQNFKMVQELYYPLDSEWRFNQAKHYARADVVSFRVVQQRVELVVSGRRVQEPVKFFVLDLKSAIVPLNFKDVRKENRGWFVNELNHIWGLWGEIDTETEQVHLKFQSALDVPLQGSALEILGDAQ